MPAGVICY